MLVLFAVVALAGAEPAAASPAPAAPAASTPKLNKDGKICVTKADTGTRFKTKSCYTKAEYERQQLEQRQALDRMQRIPAKSN